MDLRKWPVFAKLGDEVLSKIRLAFVFGLTGQEVIFVTNENNMFGMGPNSFGCLGTGDLENHFFPKEITSLSKKKVTGISCGNGPHVLICTTEGDVYSWGHNLSCELGNGTGNPLLQPTIIALLSTEKIIQVACGGYHSLALSETGEVFGWGQNKFGQTGTNINTNQCHPKKINNNALHGKFVSSIACGYASSYALLDTGEVYSWGINTCGQLGTGNSSNLFAPAKVKGLDGVKIIQIASGYSHVIVLSNCAEVYVWGSNSHGQLGIGNKNSCAVPVKILKRIGRVMDVAANHYHHMSAAINIQNQIYIWGECNGSNICDPLLVNYSSLHEAFAFSSFPPVSYKPIIPCTNVCEPIVSTLRDAFDNEVCCDITIIVRGQPIKAHKSILKIRCSHFRSMFQDPWSENNQDKIEIDTFSYPIYKAFIRYLYTNEIDSNIDDALGLLELANAYCEESLKQMCGKIIRSGINVDNVIVFYSTAVAFHMTELEEFCFNFALHNATAVVSSQSFTELDGETLKSFIIKLSHHDAFKY